MESFSDLFNLDNLDDLKKLIESLKGIDGTYDALISKLKKYKSTHTQALSSVVNDIESLNKALEKLKSTSKEGQDDINNTVKQIDVSAEAYRQLKEQIAGLEKQIQSLTAEKKKVQKQRKSLNEVDEKAIKLEAQLGQTISKNAKEHAELKLQISENNKRLKEEAKETIGLISIYQKQTKRLRDMKNNYKDLVLQNKQNTKEAKNLKLEIDDLDTKLKSLDDSVGDHTRHVGGYAEALEQVGGSAGKSVSGVKALGQSLKALLKNPVVLVIAAIVVSLAAIYKAFKRTKIGSDLFADGAAYLEGIISGLTGVVNDVTVALQKVFDDPLASITNFGKSIIDHVINTFKTAIKIGKLFGDSIVKLFQGDWEGIQKNAEEGLDAIIELNSGVIEVFTGVTQRVKESANAFLELERAQRAVRKENRELEKSAERLITQEELLKVIRDDATNSFAKREAASEKVRQTVEKRAQAEMKLAKNNLDLLNREVKLRRANGEQISDLLDEQHEAYKAFVQAERDYTLAVAENEKERRMLVQDRGEMNLDIARDAYDTTKSVNERIIADERRVLAERRLLFEQTKKLGEESYRSQIASIQETTDEIIHADSLIAESNSVVLVQRIRLLGLSEIMEKQLLDTIRERRTVVQDLADIERDLAKEEEERFKRRNAVTQFEVDRMVARRDLEVKFGTQRLKSLDERLKAELRAEEFRKNTLLIQEGLLEEERRKIKQESEDRITEIQRNAAQERIAIMQEEAMKFGEFVGAVGGLFDAFAERRNQRDQERIARLDEQQQIELEIAGENAEAREAIEKRFEEEKAKLERQQAQRARRMAVFQKALAVSQSIIDTSLAVVSALKNPPGPPVTIPAAISAGIFGSVRTATIAAQPIPAFAKGTNYAPGGVALVGEKGREIIETPSGKSYLTPDKATLVDVPEGSKVLTNSITENILKQRAINDSASNKIQKINKPSSDNVYRIENERLLEGFKDVLGGIEIHQFKFGRRGLAKDVRRGNTVIKDIESENNF